MAVSFSGDHPKSSLLGATQSFASPDTGPAFRSSSSFFCSSRSRRSSASKFAGPKAATTNPRAEGSPTPLGVGQPGFTENFGWGGGGGGVDFHLFPNRFAKFQDRNGWFWASVQPLKGMAPSACTLVTRWESAPPRNKAAPRIKNQPGGCKSLVFIAPGHSARPVKPSLFCSSQCLNNLPL